MVSFKRGVAWSSVHMLTMAILFLVGMAAAQSYYENKRSDANQRPFFMGSRYGRSGQKLTAVPRNDRFFMGSRYGKRGLPGTTSAPATLSCLYTGVPQLYRCSTEIRKLNLDEGIATDDSGSNDDIGRETIN